MKINFLKFTPSLVVVKAFIKHNFFHDLLFDVRPVSQINKQRGQEYCEWLGEELVGFVNEFFIKYGLGNSLFKNKMNRIFKTDRFDILFKKWIINYFLDLFNMLDGYRHCDTGLMLELVLEDNPINRFGTEKYYLRFGNLPNIHWLPWLNFFRRLLSLPIFACYLIYNSIKPGVRMSFRKKKKYKILREALWGLEGRGYFFHDDFLVDGVLITEDDLLLFSRPNIASDITGRFKAYQDAVNSSYAFCSLSSLKISVSSLFFRIIPKYIIGSVAAVVGEIRSKNFTLYESVLFYFMLHAMSYEKLFSSYTIGAELGHGYFSAGHIAESIVCQNYGTRYYLMHWSDHAIKINKYITSFLGCDKYFIWGSAHIQGAEGDSSIYEITGYVFKRFIMQLRNRRQELCKEMGITPRGKIIAFFDESFGTGIAMTVNHYLNFWKAILKIAQNEPEATVLVKPKGDLYEYLSAEMKKDFFGVHEELKKLANVYIIDCPKWSFIEAIAVSDVVITQGMTSSATIALICGIEGLYLDEFGYAHPLANRFKGCIVFSNTDELALKVKEIVRNNVRPSSEISEEMLRSFDAYPDDRGIDIFRRILCAQ